jgi:hypothetical protein
MPYLDEGIGIGITHKCRDWNVSPVQPYHEQLFRERPLTFPTSNYTTMSPRITLSTKLGDSRRAI